MSILESVSRAWEWAYAHPYEVTILAGAAASAFNWAAKPRSAQEYAAMPPRRAAFHRLMSSVFPDPQKAIESTKHLILATRPASAPALVVLGTTELTDAVAAVLARRASSPPPTDAANP